MQHAITLNRNDNGLLYHLDSHSHMRTVIIYNF